jgi:hypothetical protein
MSTIFIKQVIILFLPNWCVGFFRIICDCMADRKRSVLTLYTVVNTPFYHIYGPFSDRKRCRFDRPGMAELIDNVLFVIDIYGNHDGCDVLPYSLFDEEEHLLAPYFMVSVRSCQFDQDKNKWIIYLQSSRLLLPNQMVIS